MCCFSFACWLVCRCSVWGWLCVFVLFCGCVILVVGGLFWRWCLFVRYYRLAVGFGLGLMIGPLDLVVFGFLSVWCGLFCLCMLFRFGWLVSGVACVVIVVGGLRVCGVH